jgi:hypothetical protein
MQGPPAWARGGSCRDDGADGLKERRQLEEHLAAAGELAPHREQHLLLPGRTIEVRLLLDRSNRHLDPALPGPCVDERPRTVLSRVSRRVSTSEAAGKAELHHAQRVDQRLEPMAVHEGVVSDRDAEWRRTVRSRLRMPQQRASSGVSTAMSGHTRQAATRRPRRSC